jgi:transposase
MSSGMSTTPFTLTSDPHSKSPILRYGTGKPRFLADLSRQLDALVGCPDAQVPAVHLARAVLEMVELLDTASLERAYSSLGRHGLHPKRKLAVLLYASLTGLHEATKIARAARTDAAYRLLTGGHGVSETMLRTFRRENAAFFEQAIQETVTLAARHDLVQTTELAVDSVRLRADASTRSIRSLARSEARLEELGKIDRATLDGEALEKHDRAVEKHSDGVRRCQEEDRTSLSLTNPLAAMIKFPGGGAFPGHRVTVVACGAKLRFVLAVLIGSSATDTDTLRPAMDAARRTLDAAGLIDAKLQVAADAGFLGLDDLAYADEMRGGAVDVLTNDPRHTHRGKSAKIDGFLGKDRFDFLADGSVVCPAGRAMTGPVKSGRGIVRYTGVGCAKCPLKAQCTPSAKRVVCVHPEKDALH